MLTPTNAVAWVPHYREVWARVLPGLRRLHASSERQDWSVESVQLMLEDGTAILAVDPEEPGAFAVLILGPHIYDLDELELFVQLASHPGAHAFERFEPVLQNIASHAGAKYIRFFSQRIGMVRLATRLGYVPTATEYVKEVSHGRRKSGA